MCSCQLELGVVFFLNWHFQLVSNVSDPRTNIYLLYDLNNLFDNLVYELVNYLQCITHVDIVKIPLYQIVQV